MGTLFRPHRLVFPILAAAVGLASAEDGKEISSTILVDDCDPAFVVRLRLTSSETAGRLIVNEVRPGTGYALSVEGGQVALARLDGPVPHPLLGPTQLRRRPAAGDSSTVTLIRETDGLAVLQEGAVLGRLHDSRYTGGRATWAGQGVSAPRYQPTEPILFTDDFMREEGYEGGWIPRAGTWKLSGVTELKSTRDRRQGIRKADPAKSANAFQYSATHDQPSLATIGYWFWHDYAVTAAVRPVSATTVGLVAYAQHNGDGLRFEWGSGEEGVEVCRIVERLQGKDRNLATRLADAPATSPFAPHQWYLLRFVVEGGEARAYLDGREVCRANGVRLGIGPVGLFAAGGRDGLSASFDDVRVESAGQPDRAVGDTWTRPFEITETFTKDSLMSEWSAAMADWRRRGNVWEHRGWFFDKVTVRFPPALMGSPRSVRFVEETGEGKEQRVLVGRLGERLRAVILEGEEVLASNAVAWDADADTVSVRRSAEGTDVRAGEQVVCRHAAEPATSSLAVRLDAARTGDLPQIEVTSPSAFDTAFATAPVEWWVARGDWGLTQRWACSPEWSFFGGAESFSSPSPLIWSKDRFAGDQLIEFWAATQYSGEPERSPSDLNVAFCADGRDLSSGYNFIFAGGGQQFDRLMRGNEVLAERPFRERRTKPHQMWNHVRIEKRGGQLRCLVDGKPVFEERDPNPLPGGHLGLWTLNGGIVLPRVRVWSQSRLPGVPTYLPPPADAPGTGKGAPANDFEETLGSWTTGDEPERPGLALDPSTAFGGRQSLRITNRIGGGHFAVWATKQPVSAAKCRVLHFAYRLQPTVKINLYAQIGAVYREITLTVSGYKAGSRNVLGAIEGVVADDQWHEAELDLHAALKSRGLDPEAAIIESLAFAAPDAEYIRAGLGGNPLGATFWIDEFRLTDGDTAA